MTLGLGTGSTAHHFITGLGPLVAGGVRLRGIATSVASAELGRQAGLEMLPDQAPLERPLDLAVDGADEVDDELRLVKGHGGALFREKLVALAAARFIVIADSTKLVQRLGRAQVPVEVAGFLWRQTARRLEALGAAWTLRGGESAPYLTDNRNLVLDLTFPGGLSQPESTAAALKAVPGVIEHGLFCGLASGAVVAGPEGIRILGRLD